MDEHQDLVVDARTINEGDGWTGSGANPWHLDTQTNSILFLTDEGNKPVRISAFGSLWGLCTIIWVGGADIDF